MCSYHYNREHTSVSREEPVNIQYLIKAITINSLQKQTSEHNNSTTKSCPTPIKATLLSLDSRQTSTALLNNSAFVRAMIATWPTAFPRISPTHTNIPNQLDLTISAYVFLPGREHPLMIVLTPFISASKVVATDAISGPNLKD